MNFKIHISGLTENLIEKLKPMIISSLQNSDIELTGELQPPDWTDMKPHLKYYVNSSQCFPIKISIKGEIVGIGTTVKHSNTAWLAHIIVHPDFRNKGIGKKITDALVKSIDKRRYKTIYLVATELGAPVYKKSGFEIETEYVLLENENGNFQSKICEFIFPFEDKYRNEIFELDKYVTGENREIRLNEVINGSSVLLANGKVSGTYFPDLGNGLIIAKDPAAGIELTKLRLQKNDHSIIPEGNKQAIEFLIQNNFKQKEKKKRMILGKKREWHPENLYNWVSGQIG